MDVNAFWELIERSRQETGDPQARLGWFQRQLAQQPTAEIVLVDEPAQEIARLRTLGACRSAAGPG
jgi:hypothetical protein